MRDFNKERRYAQEKKRKEMIHDFLLPRGSTWEDILYASIESYKFKMIYLLDLFDSTSWEEIYDTMRKLNAMEEGLDENATWDEIISIKIKQLDKTLQLLQQGCTLDEIKNIISEDKRRKQAISLGLPEDATWDKISVARCKKYAIDEAHKLGLPEDTDYFDILSIYSDIRRKESAKSLDLPEDATWQEIHDANDKNNRKMHALNLGLPEESSWELIRYVSHSFDRKHDIRSGKLSGSTLEQVNYYLEKLENEEKLELEQNISNYPDATLFDDVIHKCDEVEEKGKILMKSLDDLDVSIPWIF